MDKCLTVDEFERRACGKMAEDDVRRFDAHISTCKQCRAIYESYVSDNRFLGDVKNALDAPDAQKTLSVEQEAIRLGPEEEMTLPVSEEAASAHRERFPEIADFEIKRVLGRGGMGIVYEAIQKKLNRRVALKLLPTLVSSAHPEFVTRFHREAAAAAKLHHTNIIPVYDCGQASDGYFYAMELINGQSLGTLIKRLAKTDAPKVSATALASLLSNPDSFEQDETSISRPDDSSTGSGGTSTGSKGRGYYRQVARWMADVAEAIHYAHLQGMIHRDIKPSNLMLSTDGRIMVLDFGLVKVASDQSVTATGSLLGTYRYMSPEQIGAKRIRVDARSDIYSLGATFYELLTFRPAFDALEQSELLGQILFQEPTPPRRLSHSIPLDLQTICLKAMEKAPQDRYQSAQLMADDLNFYLQDQAIVARPQGVCRRIFKFVRRRRIETIAITAILCLVVAVGVVHRLRKQVREEQRQVQEAKRTELLKEGVDAHWKEHDSDRAIRAFRAILSMNPDDYSALLNLASVCKDQYYALGEQHWLDEAKTHAHHATVVAPQRPEAWNILGVLNQALNQPAEAIDAFDHVLQLNKDFYPTWVNLAILHAMKGDIEEAERCAQQGVDLSREENDIMPLRILAAIQVHLGRAGADETLDAARTLSRNRDIAILVIQARHHLKQGGEENNRIALDLAVSANTLVGVEDTTIETRIQVKRTLAMARLRGHQWQAAADAARAAIVSTDDSAIPLFILAIASRHLGDTAATHTHLQAAEEAWPGGIETAGYQATEKGSKSLWFVTRQELQSLRDEVRSPDGGPLGSTGNKSRGRNLAGRRFTHESVWIM